MANFFPRVHPALLCRLLFSLELWSLLGIYKTTFQFQQEINSTVSKSQNGMGIILCRGSQDSLDLVLPHFLLMFLHHLCLSTDLIEMLTWLTKNNLFIRESVSQRVGWWYRHLRTRAVVGLQQFTLWVFWLPVHDSTGMKKQIRLFCDTGSLWFSGSPQNPTPFEPPG